MLDTSVMPPRVKLSLLSIPSPLLPYAPMMLRNAFGIARPSGASALRAEHDSRAPNGMWLVDEAASRCKLRCNGIGCLMPKLIRFDVTLTLGQRTLRLSMGGCIDWLCAARRE